MEEASRTAEMALEENQPDPTTLGSLSSGEGEGFSDSE